MARMKLETVTGENIELSDCAGYCLNFVVQCGQDWIAEISIHDGKFEKNHRSARVYVSKNPGVHNLMALAHERGELRIK